MPITWNTKLVLNFELNFCGELFRNTKKILQKKKNNPSFINNIIYGKIKLKLIIMLTKIGDYNNKKLTSQEFCLVN